MFSLWSVPSGYLEDNWGGPRQYKENPSIGNIRGLNLAADKPYDRSSV
jgi:hypothetical protein